MRRSGAPSRRSVNQINITSFEFSSTKSTVINNEVAITNPVPTTENHFAKTIFNVVWSKITSKKHKTWEGDGTLEVKEKFIMLRDITGQILGTSNTFKIEDLFEGNKIIVGSKEIEIQEQLNAKSSLMTFKRKNTDENKDENLKEKKKKHIGIFSPNLQLTTVPKMTRTLPKIKKPDLQIPSSNTYNNLELILPSPSCAHQWEYNKNKKPLTEVKVSPILVKHLRNHQRAGVIFLYECLLGFRNPNYFGAILADEMGLGKTLQCLTICHTLLKQGPYGNRSIQRVLVVTPSSLTQTWCNEINKWLVGERMYAYVIDMKHKPKHYTKSPHIPFVIVSYESLVNYCDDFEQMNFDLLICDEGHRLKNNNNKTSICLKQLNIKRIIILTGTPIQNDLQEFFNLIDFVNPGILGSYQEYKYQYETPICKSQSPNADEETILLGNQRAEELNKITNSFILRRLQSINNEYLPRKREYIIFIKPSELQQILLKEVLIWYDKNQNDLTNLNINHLQIINILQKICNHPALIRNITNKNSITEHLENYLPHWSAMGPFDSNKLLIVQEILNEIIPLKNEKIVLVSNQTKTLDMIQGLCDHFEYKYLRLDGQTPSTERNKIVNKFNCKNSDYFIFLLSAKAGGVGLNLSGASRLILYDNDWNPATDLQAMSRIWRDGQKMDVKIYRLITTGTIEEKIFQRQIAKTTLGGYVMNQTIDMNTMKFSKEELKDLFTIQDNYENCSIHDCLNCNCNGNGEKFTLNSSGNNVEDPFRITFNLSSETETPVQINELMAWEHYKTPISEEFLKESSLLNANENITFIFSNLIEFSHQN